MIELTVLGSGTALPTATRSPSGYLVRGDGFRFLLDAGPGTMGRLARAGTSIDEIDLVFVTHFHPDHTLDLMALIFALTNPRFHESYERLTIVGPEGIEELYQGMRALYGRWMEPVTYELVRRVAEPGMRFPGGVTVSPFPMRHTRSSVGYRIEHDDGTVLAYSGDTDYCEAAVELGRDADLFVLECAFPEGEHRDGHLTPALAGKIAAAAGCRRLLLTHFYPECDGSDLIGPCAAWYHGEILLAADGLRLEV